jgi:hypothetical protein
MINIIKEAIQFIKSICNKSRSIKANSKNREVSKFLLMIIQKFTKGFSWFSIRKCRKLKRLKSRLNRKRNRRILKISILLLNQIFQNLLKV